MPPVCLVRWGMGIETRKDQGLSYIAGSRTARTGIERESQGRVTLEERECANSCDARIGHLAAGRSRRPK